MKGFKYKPTTHYMRQFQIAKERNSVCHYGRTSFKINLDYGEDFMRIYKRDGFFGFNHIKQYTHDENKNNIAWLDDILLEFLKRFKVDESISSNTILFLFSDHGPRYSSIRKSMKGLLNERNPFFSVYIPDLFKKRYPSEYKNLKDNLNKVIAPMDIHASLLNLINLENKFHNKIIDHQPVESDNDDKKRGISIFGKISPHRNCQDAGIDSYWCACLKRTEIPIDSKLIQMANTFVRYLNEVILKEHLDVCHQLELDTVDSVFLMNSHIDPSEQRFFKTNDTKTDRLFIQPPKIETNYNKYLFQIKTKPNSAEYEFTLTVENDISIKSEEDLIKLTDIDKKQISRLNKYGNDEHCIHDTFPDLRKFCYCK